MDMENKQSEVMAQLVGLCKDIVVEALSIVKEAIDTSGKVEFNDKKLNFEQRLSFMSIFLDEHIKAYKGENNVKGGTNGNKS